MLLVPVKESTETKLLVTWPARLYPRSTLAAQSFYRDCKVLLTYSVHSVPLSSFWLAWSNQKRPSANLTDVQCQTYNLVSAVSSALHPPPTPHMNLKQLQASSLRKQLFIVFVVPTVFSLRVHSAFAVAACPRLYQGGGGGSFLSCLFNPSGHTFAFPAAGSLQQVVADPELHVRRIQDGGAQWKYHKFKTKHWPFGPYSLWRKCRGTWVPRSPSVPSDLLRKPISQTCLRFWSKWLGVLTWTRAFTDVVFQMPSFNSLSTEWKPGKGFRRIWSED